MSKMPETMLCCVILICLQCSKPVSVTETDTGQISGWVVDKQGRNVRDADVLLRSADITRDVAPGSRAVDSVRTSTEGFFRFSGIAAGDYLIEINDHDSLGSVAEVTIIKESPVTSVDTIEIGKLGIIRGSIDPSMIGGDSTFLYIVELDRRIPVDSLGRFLTGHLPAREYTIRLVTNTTVTPSRLDTVVISVMEEDTVAAYNIGTRSGSVIIDGPIDE